MWRGSWEDKGCIEAREKGQMIQACECTAPKTQPPQVTSTKLPFYTPPPLRPILYTDAHPALASHRAAHALNVLSACPCYVLASFLQATVDHRWDYWIRS